MRRLIGPVLVGLGVFLIVAAGLVRFYAVPTLAKVPSGYNSTTHLEATGAQIFNSDPDVLASETHDLVITSETREDASADAPDGVVVWVNVTTTDKADGSNFQQSTERVAFDEADGDAVDCDACETWIAESDGETVEEVPTTFEGQIYKFPFNTQRKAYDVWDGTTGEAVPAEYEGEESIQGIRVYKFVQVIEPTVIETRDVPGSVFGEEETVQADMEYAMTRTFYVEPVTGAPVHRVEERVQELVYDGERVPAFVGTIHYTDDQVDENVDAVDTKSTLLGGTRVLYPVILLVLGLLLLGVGLILNRRLSSDVDDKAQENRPLVTA
jgi:hypothetical protein